MIKRIRKKSDRSLMNRKTDFTPNLANDIRDDSFDDTFDDKKNRGFCEFQRMIINNNGPEKGVVNPEIS